MENSVFDLSELLRNLAARFEPEVKRKRIELSIKFDPAIPGLLIGDSGRIGQILINLITNALKFTEDGKVMVSATLVNEINGAPAIRFTVTDTGIGITKDLLPHIFDPFVQAHNQITRKHDGSGLGLWITKMLLQLMNSSISVYSVAKKGAEFSFVLTLPKASAMVDGNRMVTDLSQMRILLVEDNAMNIKVATTFLQKWNAHVDIANNGMEAVALHKSKKYDLILMDIHMPEMNGYQATEIIRETDKKIPIIALTADAFDESRERALKAGMNDFVTKPFNPEFLFNMIVKYSLILILLNSPFLQTESGRFVKSLLKQVEGKRDEESPLPNNQS